MRLRLATLLAAAAVLVGGCAQSGLGDRAGESALSDFEALASMLPVDVISDGPPAARANPAQPIKAATWGEATVTPERSDAPPSDWGSTAVNAAPPVTADGWDTATVSPAPPARLIAPEAAPAKPAPVKVAGWGGPVVSPVPVGPPMAHRPPPGPPVIWGPGVVVNAALTGGPTGYEPYILDTGDKLRVFVYGQPNLSRLYVVDQIGNIAIPLIGTVHARGRTTIDLEHAIAAKLGREFVKDPQVTVDVAQNRPFFILGEVRLPGQYPFVSGMTIEQAVAIGGGYTERASQRSFRITRKLGALVDQIEAPGDYTLCPGDTVFVYERLF
jgi:polysaccharide export outer membrane protein